jgi:ABC-2 type transport system ATP-binding protein
MLKISGVSKSYGKIKAVDNLSFEVKPGEIFGLLGVNGSGKTTTFRMIMGLLSPDEGKITLEDKVIDYSITDKIGFLTEERSLLLKMTVLEQTLFYGALKGMTKDLIISRLDSLLEKFQIKEYKNRKIKELSKGNQQKIQFINAIINEPSLLILDEPFSGLDPINVKMFEDEIKEMSKKGSMIIFSSHRMEHVEQFCEKLVIIKKGHSVLEGSLVQIKKDYGKKNLLIKGEVDIDKLFNLEGVVSVDKENNHYVIKILSDDYVNSIFREVSKMSNITMFKVEEPSLNEIFIAKVGESYE